MNVEKRFERMTRFVLALAVMLSTIIFVGADNRIAHANSTVQSNVVDLMVNISGLEDLGANAVYEGWLITSMGPVSTGTFTVDSTGAMSQTVFQVPISMADATAYVLTIEPAVDLDPAPADTHLLAGDITNGTGNLSIAHPAALNNDFSGATGDYILAVPTSTGSDGADYFNGIWFLDPAGGPGASLSLPTLPAGWAYEGWVVVGGSPISTGTFTGVTGADSDGGGATAGANPAPPFPGQDFVSPATDLRGGAAVISIEPVPDNSPAPFTLKPLVDMSIDDTGGPGIVQAMANNSASAPTGTVMLEESILVELSCSGLEDLGPDFVYETWLIDANGAQTGGRFSVDGAGNLSETFFTASVSALADVTTYVLTIEPNPDPNPGPSATHLLGGAFVNGSTTATIDHGAALGDDFSGATGGYILGVPTSDGSDGAGYFNGIWFLDPAGGPGASLSLPTLPAGWAYEGWVVVGGSPISTGTFLNPAAADSDGGGATAGTNPAPPFPGQDFINPLTDLRGGTAVISIEPVPDNSPAPFSLKPLVDMTIDDTGGPGIVQAMANNATDLPNCKVDLALRDVTSVGMSASSAEFAPNQTATVMLLTVAVISSLTIAVISKTSGFRKTD